MSLPSAQLEFPRRLVELGVDTYAAEAVWRAPRRALQWRGREAILQGLLREAAAMRRAELTPLRSGVADGCLIDEYCVRFVHRGPGLENLALPPDARVELERLRILRLCDGLIVEETAIETWTVLDTPVPRAG